MRFLSRVCALLALFPLCAFADDWPQWRGPNRNGISAEKAWLDVWPDQGPKIAWKGDVGLGYSSLVIANNRVFTAGHKDPNDTVFCFDATTGAEIWKHSYPAELGDKYFQGGTTGTPTVDQDHLYWLSRWGDLFCFDAATGKVIWNKNIQKETDVRVPDWGYAGSVCVSKELLVLNVGDAGMGVDKKSGKILWQSANKDAGYSTPLPLRRGAETLMVIGSRQSYVAVNPDTGKEGWRIPWLTEYGVNSADPLVAGDHMFIASGYEKGCALFDISQNPPQQIWKSKVIRSHLNGGVLFEGNIYACDGNSGNDASLKCVDFETGKERWAVPKIGTGGLVIADGKLIVLGARGELMVAPASPKEFKTTARAQVLGGSSWTSPVLANGRIYCRNSYGRIVCVDARKTQ